MAVSLKHAFTSAIPDGGDTSLVQPSNWNAEHNLTMGTGALLGRTTAGTGAAEEITAGTGLTLSAGSLAVSVTTPQTNTSNTFTANQIISVTDNTNAALRITQLGTGEAIRVEDSTNPDSTPFVVDSAGKVGIGVSPVQKFQIYDAASSVLRVEGDATTLMQMYRYADDANASSVQLYKGRGTKASPTIVSSGDALGSIFIAGHNGSGNFNTLTRIDSYADTVTSGTSMSSSIRFGTANAASSATERFRFGPAGQLGIGGANYGSSGQVLTSGGASSAPSWTTPNDVTVTTYTAASPGPGQWTKPPTGSFVRVRLWSAGGSGGKNTNTTASSGQRAYGGGGGGYLEHTYRFSELGSTVSYSIGAGGTAITATTSTNGNPGGNTVFGSLTCYGGGGGGQGGPGTNGGSGGSFGNSGTAFWDGTGGNSGSQVSETGFYGAGGGGGCGDGTTSTVIGPPDTSIFAGAGGAGNATSGGTAGSGTAPGGGGGGKMNGTGGSSGAGAGGQIEIWVW